MLNPHLAPLLLLLAVAGVLDFRHRRIPNLLPGLIMLSAVATLALFPDTAVARNWGAAAVGFGLAVAALMPGYMLGAMGAGDVKLMAASGFWLGWPLALVFLIGWVLMLGLWCGIAALSGNRQRQPAAPAMFLAALATAIIAVGG